MLFQRHTRLVFRARLSPAISGRDRLSLRCKFEVLRFSVLKASGLGSGAPAKSPSESSSWDLPQSLASGDRKRPLRALGRGGAPQPLQTIQAQTGHSPLSSIVDGWESNPKRNRQRARLSPKHFWPVGSCGSTPSLRQDGHLDVLPAHQSSMLSKDFLKAIKPEKPSFLYRTVWNAGSINHPDFLQSNHT